MCCDTAAQTDSTDLKVNNCMYSASFLEVIQFLEKSWWVVIEPYVMFYVKFHKWPQLRNSILDRQKKVFLFLPMDYYTA